MLVKRNELGGLKSLIQSAEADQSYAGSAVIGSTQPDGTVSRVTIEVADETKPAS